MDYKEFKVLVEDTERILVTRPSGVTIRGTVNMDKLKEKMLDIFNSWLARNKIEERKELVILGSYLYSVLFDGEISSAFKTTFDEIQLQKDVTLRVELEFEEKARELASLPWEYLYYPDTDRGGGFFIAARSKLILTRHVPLNVAVKNLKPVEKTLRILIVTCQPEGIGEGIGAFKFTKDSWENLRNENIPDEILGDLKDLEDREFPGENEILNAVKKHTQNDQIDRYVEVILKHTDIGVVGTIEKLQTKFSDTIEIKKLDTPTKRKFTNEVQGFRPHVLHFIGYGRSDQQTGYLAFVQNEKDKAVRWINHIDLADAFMDFQPRLIFLSTREGAKSDSYEGFKQLALQLVRSNIPAVVAMQYPIDNKIAAQFTKKFYECLGEGEPIDVAVQQGRLELGVYLDEKNFISRAFGSPMVYLQSAEGIIIAKKQEKTEEFLQPLPVSEKELPCPYPDPSGRGRCVGRLRVGEKFCPECEKEVRSCPECKKEGENHLMSRKEDKNKKIQYFFCSTYGHKISIPRVGTVKTSVDQKKRKQPGKKANLRSGGAPKGLSGGQSTRPPSSSKQNSKAQKKVSKQTSRKTAVDD